MIYLDKDQLTIVKSILKKHLPNKQVVAFGSRVSGSFKTYSDLDLCVMGETPLSFLALANIREAFSKSDLPIKVDIVDWQSITPEFQAIIKARNEPINIRLPSQ